MTSEMKREPALRCGGVIPFTVGSAGSGPLGLGTRQSAQRRSALRLGHRASESSWTSVPLST